MLVVVQETCEGRLQLISVVLFKGSFIKFLTSP